jgi:hypothetical protein
MHTGVFYEIGGGLFGGDAQLVERLAEDDAKGGEILVTHELAQRFQAPKEYALTRRTDLDPLHAPGVFSLRSPRRMPGLREAESLYPHPFPPEFFAMLRDPALRAAAVAAEGTGGQMVERYVAFLARKGAARSEENLASVLDELLVNEGMNRIVEESLGGSAEIAETAGGLAIVVFEQGGDAIDFARAVRERFRERALPVSIGIDRGPVLLFPKGPGRAGTIAGDPINLSSKISEDLGEAHRIRITERAAEGLSGVDRGERFEETISGVRICGLIL